MIFNIVVACAMLFITAGCMADREVGLLHNRDSVITIGLEEGRTSLGESVDGFRKVYWTAGDCIAANGVVSSEAQIDATYAGVAKFEFSTLLTYPCNILYPASYYKSADVIKLPNLQKAEKSSFATNTLPMATCVESADDVLAIHHLMGVVQLQLKASPGEKPDFHPLFKVEFMGGANEPVCGEFYIDYNTLELTPVEGKTFDKIIVQALDEPVSTTDITNIYIVVPAREYPSGFKIRVMDMWGHYMDVAKESRVHIERGEVLRMSAIEFKPHSTAFDIELNQER
jgi:hypothetical protein